MSSPGDAHQWRGPSAGYWFETGSQLCGGTGNSHYSRVYIRYWCRQRQQHPGVPDRPAAIPWCGAPKRCHRRSLHPGRHHCRDHHLQTHRWAVESRLKAKVLQLFWKPGWKACCYRGEDVKIAQMGVKVHTFRQFSLQGIPGVALTCSHEKWDK